MSSMDARSAGVLLVVACIAIGILGACADSKGPPGFNIQLAKLPSGTLQPYQREPSGRQDSLLLLCNTILPDGRMSSPKQAAVMQLSYENEAPILRLTEKYELLKDTFLECLLPENGIVIAEDLATNEPKLWIRKEAMVESATPENFAEVLARPHAGGWTVFSCDTESNLYLWISPDDQTDELWVGKASLRMVDNLPKIRCLGTYWGESGRQVMAISDSNQISLVDGKTAQVVDAPELAWIGEVLARDATSRSAELRGLYLVDSLACARFMQGEPRHMKPVTRFYSKSGESFSMKLFVSADVKPSGIRRNEAEAQRMIEYPQSLIAEGERMPVDVASDDSFCECLDESRLALVDPDYYRVLVIQATGTNK